MLTPDQVRLLASFPLFSALPGPVLDGLLKDASVAAFAQEVHLFEAGDVPSHLFVVMEGEVGLTADDDSGELTLVEILRPGAAFIEAAVMTDQPTLMGAKALRDSTVLRLPAAKVRDGVACSPELASAMVHSLSAHFRLMVAEIKDLKLKSAGQRLALYLLELAGPRDGAVRVILPHSKGIIAARIGIRRETLSRVFNALKTVGVSSKGPCVTVTDMARLREFSAK